jgi:hypothetical protein
MSGHKKTTVTASISEGEYRQLHDQEMRAQFSPAITAEIRTEITNNVQANYQIMENRQVELSQNLSDLNQNLQDFENKTSHLLLNNQQNILDIIKQQYQDINDDYTHLLVNTANYFNEQLDKEKKQREEELEYINRQLSQIFYGENKKMELALLWYRQTSVMYQFIAENYPCDQIIPGEIDNVIQQLDFVKNNIENGLPEASITKAQDLYLTLSSMRIYLEKYLSDLNLLLQAAWLQANQLYQVMTSSPTCKAIDIDGKELDIPIQIDYWSSGKLTKLINHVGQILDTLELDESLPKIDDLKGLIDQELPALQAEFSEMVYKTRLNALHSQIRVNIADIVINALKDQGYSLEYNEYHHHDMRQGYKLKAVNIAGSEVVVSIDPMPEESGKNSLDIKMKDPEPRTEHELRQRSKEITKALGVYGLHVGPVDVIQDKPANLDYQTDHLRQQRRQK